MLVSRRPGDVILYLQVNPQNAPACSEPVGQTMRNDADPFCYAPKKCSQRNELEQGCVFEINFNFKTLDYAQLRI